MSKTMELPPKSITDNSLKGQLTMTSCCVGTTVELLGSTLLITNWMAATGGQTDSTFGPCHSLCHNLALWFGFDYCET